MINTFNSFDNDKFRKEYVVKNISEGMQFFKLQLASSSTYSHQNDPPQIFRLILSLNSTSLLVFLLLFDRPPEHSTKNR